MALQIVCDGCGSPVEEGREFEQGQYNKVQYCRKCNDLYVKEFEEPIKAKRAEMAARFDSFLEGLKLVMKKDMKFKKLPDEADNA